MTIPKGFVATFAGLIAIYLPAVLAAPTMLSDDRVRNLDITPVLGRGYSIMTNSFLSTCLDHNETSVPSYNYDSIFTDFTRSSNMDVTLADLSYTFAYPYLKKHLTEITASRANRFNPRKYFVVSTMRVERYYSSIKEEISPLSKNAFDLLDNQDYVGFFMSCGSNYVRSIRRAQEATGVFTFESPNVDLAQSFAIGLKTSGFGSSVGNPAVSKSKFRPITESLEVKILAYGLGLNSEGGGSLVANSVDEYNRVMMFAFEAMTKASHGRYLGMVYGIELMPWVDNVAFQAAARIHDEAVEVPLQRSVMPRAYLISDPENTTFDNAQRSLYECSEESYEMDMYGYCCEGNALYNANSRKYEVVDAASQVCRPLRALDKSIVKNNMSSNGEFVTRLDAAVRHRMTQISSLEQCVSMLRTVPADRDYNIVRAQDSAKFDANIRGSMTVKELKVALDPFGDYSLVKHLTKELEEYMDMFYTTCVKAMFGGRERDSEPLNFLTAAWHVYDECLQMSCLTDGTRWDRQNTGCTPSVITGKDAPGYPANSDTYCSYDNNRAEAEEKCKFDQVELTDFYNNTANCWDKANITDRIDYIIDHFCIPTVTEEVLAEEERHELQHRIGSFCDHSTLFLHVPRVIPFGDDIVVRFTNENPLDTNWLGIYDPATVTDYTNDDLMWAYMCGHQVDGTCTPQSEGAVTFNAADPRKRSYNYHPLNPGEKEACFMVDDGADPHCTSFTILDIPDEVITKSTLILGSSIYEEGDSITATFNVPIAYQNTWIGVYNATDINDDTTSLPGAPLAWAFNGCNNISGDQTESTNCIERKTSGAVNIDSSALELGTYVLCMSFYYNLPYEKFVCTVNSFDLVTYPSAMPSTSAMPSSIPSVMPSTFPSAIPSAMPSAAGR